jgi:hypothetical protein
MGSGTVEGCSLRLSQLDPQEKRHVQDAIYRSIAWHGNCERALTSTIERLP